MSNPFDGIFDNIDLPNSDQPAPETTPIYTEPLTLFGAAVTPAQPRPQAVEPFAGLTHKQQNNICVLARDLYINGKLIDARSILDAWPTYEASQDWRLVMQAGDHPNITVVNEFLVTDEFKTEMARLGVYLGVNSLNSKQIAFLNMMADTTSKMSPLAIKRKLSITSIEFGSWLSQPAFQEAFSKNGNKALTDAIPMAKARIARKMEDGDLAFIKFGFEVTGEYNANDRKQVDAQALIRVIFEVLEEEIKDPSVLKRIGAKVQLRGSGGNVVQGSIEE